MRCCEAVWPESVCCCGRAGSVTPGVAVMSDATSRNPISPLKVRGTTPFEGLHTSRVASRTSVVPSSCWALAIAQRACSRWLADSVSFRDATPLATLHAPKGAPLSATKLGLSDLAPSTSSRLVPHWRGYLPARHSVTLSQMPCPAAPPPSLDCPTLDPDRICRRSRTKVGLRWWTDSVSSWSVPDHCGSAGGGIGGS